MRIFIASFLIFIAVLLPQQTFQYTINTFPDPQYDNKACRMEGVQDSFICDPDNLLTQKGKTDIDQVLQEIKATTSSKCDKAEGYRVYFILMNTIDQIRGCEDKSCNKAKMMADGLREKYLYHNEGCSDLILLLVSKRDKAIVISQSELTKIYLTQRVISYIQSITEKDFVQGKYDNALIQISKIFYDVLHFKESHSSLDTYLTQITVLIIIFVIIYFVRIEVNKQRKYNGCQNLLLELWEKKLSSQKQGLHNSIKGVLNEQFIAQLKSLQELYPEYITKEMVEKYEQENCNDQVLLSQFDQQNPFRPTNQTKNFQQ